jgi:hypothetical protein
VAYPAIDRRDVTMIVERLAMIEAALKRIGQRLDSLEEVLHTNGEVGANQGSASEAEPTISRQGGWLARLVRGRGR